MIPVDKAVAFARKTLHYPKIREEDLEDIAFDAYLAYWRGFVRTGNDNPASYHRDVLDAWDKFTGCRRKTRAPLFLTNIPSTWFEDHLSVMASQ